MDEDKENNQKLANSQELIEQVMKQGIVVTKKDDGQQVNIGSGQEAYYALLAQDMLNISVKYGRDCGEVHLLFYQVSCNRENLISYLEGQKGIAKWTTLEEGSSVQEWKCAMGTKCEPAHQALYPWNNK